MPPPEPLSEESERTSEPPRHVEVRVPRPEVLVVEAVVVAFKQQARVRLRASGRGGAADAATRPGKRWIAAAPRTR